MVRGRRTTAIGLLALALAGLAGCAEDARTPEVQDLEYRPGRPLDAQAVDGGREGALRLERITYASADGQRVPAQLAVPTDRRPLGCLVYQGGLGQTKEQFARLRAGAAAIRLATFTIDPRTGDARGDAEQALEAIKQPETLRSMLRNTAVDLRMGLDYLETRPECRNNIALLGTSFGGVLGTLVAAEDSRISAAVLTSIGATFKAAILVGGVAAREVADFPAPVPSAANDPELLEHAVAVLGPYDPARWIGAIAPRPVLLINGRFDPSVLPGDALALADAARQPKTVLLFDGGHDPFAQGPDEETVSSAIVTFLTRHLDLPTPSSP